MTTENKERAFQVIEMIRAGGGTNLSAGLSLAAQEMRMITNPNAIQRIFLLTDGHANVGITDTGSLQAMVCSYVSDFDCIGKQVYEMTFDGDTIQESSSSVGVKNNVSSLSLICFGYGADHNSNMLASITQETSGGAYYYIEQGSDSNVASAFGQAMGGVLSIVAQSAVLSISLPSFAKEKGIEIVQVYHDDVIDRGGGVYTVNIGDFYADETRDVIFEVCLAMLHCPSSRQYFVSC
jgi:Ca-activated chloride channel family protein